MTLPPNIYRKRFPRYFYFSNTNKIRDVFQSSTAQWPCHHQNKNFFNETNYRIFSSQGLFHLLCLTLGKLTEYAAIVHFRRANYPSSIFQVLSQTAIYFLQQCSVIRSELISLTLCVAGVKTCRPVCLSFQFSSSLLPLPAAHPVTVGFQKTAPIHVGAAEADPRKTKFQIKTLNGKSINAERAENCIFVSF